MPTAASHDRSLLRSYVYLAEACSYTSRHGGPGMTAEALKRLRKAVREDPPLTPFVGAGVSMFATGNAGPASWYGLLLTGIAVCREVFSPLPSGWAARMEAQLDNADVFTYLAVADEIRRRLEEVREGREFESWIQGSVGTLQPTPEGERLIVVLRKLAKFGSKSSQAGVILTTNYDALIENLKPEWKSVTWTDKQQWAQAISKSRMVLHLHGVVTDTSSIILSSADYQRGKTDLNTVVGSTNFISRRLLFVGCGDGLNDPDIAPLMKTMTELIPEKGTEHFMLVKGDQLRRLNQNPLCERITPIAYGRSFADLPEFLEKLVAGEELTTSQAPEFYEHDDDSAETSESPPEITGAPPKDQPAAPGSRTVTGAGATLQELAGPAQEHLRDAKAELQDAMRAMRKIEHRGTPPAGADEWNDLGDWDDVHQRIAASLTDPVSRLESRSQLVAQGISKAETYARRLSAQERFTQYAGMLTPIIALVSELETMSGRLLVKVRQVRNDINHRADVWPYYDIHRGRLSHSHEWIEQANISAFLIRQELERSQPAAGSQGTADGQPPEEQPYSGASVPGRVQAVGTATTEVPVVGRAAAGPRIPTGEGNSESVRVPSVMIPRGKVVAVLVRGDSMLGDDLHDGDYVILNRDQSPKDKDIVVVRTGGQADSEAMVKRIRLNRDGTLLRLESSNPNSPEEVVKPEENPQLEGIVIGIFRASPPTPST
jgi:SOS-response transcriptional repressor LexA